MMPFPSTQEPLLTAVTTVTAVNLQRASRRRPSLTTPTSYLRRARVSSRRLLRDLAMRVRGPATEQRQRGWAYTWAAMILDLVYNLGFIIASICVMITSMNEVLPPGVHLRVWIVGYVLLCGVHVGCAVSLECKRRNRVGVLDGESSEAVRDENLGSGSDGEDVLPNRDGEQVVVQISNGEDGQQTHHHRDHEEETR